MKLHRLGRQAVAPDTPRPWALILRVATSLAPGMGAEGVGADAMLGTFTHHCGAQP
jgi:hypothetical protein